MFPSAEIKQGSQFFRVELATRTGSIQTFRHKEDFEDNDIISALRRAKMHAIAKLSLVEHKGNFFGNKVQAPEDFNYDKIDQYSVHLSYIRIVKFQIRRHLLDTLHMSPQEICSFLKDLQKHNNLNDQQLIEVMEILEITDHDKFITCIK